MQQVGEEEQLDIRGVGEKNAVVGGVERRRCSSSWEKKGRKERG